MKSLVLLTQTDKPFTPGHKTELMEENMLELCSQLGTLQGLNKHFRTEWEIT